MLGVCFLVAALLVGRTPPPLAAAELHPALAELSGPAARVLELTNIERQNAGLSPLASSPQLGQAAQAYSQVLASGGCFAHTCGPVPDMAQRIEQAGYTGWTAVGENIAAGYQTPEAVVAGWMASPGHRANILNPQYTEIGIGLVTNGKMPYGTYWTQDFGTRPGGAAPAFQPVFEQDPSGDAGPPAEPEDDTDADADET